MNMNEGLPGPIQRYYWIKKYYWSLVYLARYFKVDASISVQNEHSNFINMWQSPNIAHIVWMTWLPRMNDRLLSQLNRYLTYTNSPYLPMHWHVLVSNNYWQIIKKSQMYTNKQIKVCLHHHQQEKSSRMGQISFLIILKDRLSWCSQNKRKTVATHTIHLMRSLVLLLKISLQHVALYRYSKYLSLLLVFLSSPHSFDLHLRSYRNH